MTDNKATKTNGSLVKRDGFNVVSSIHSMGINPKEAGFFFSRARSLSLALASFPNEAHFGEMLSLLPRETHL